MSTPEKYKAMQSEIMIVDDNPGNLKVLEEILTKNNYHVRLATSAEMAIISINALKPDLLLLDVEMPKMNGYQFCRKLKNDNATKDIPVLFLTVHDTPAERIKGFEAGGADFIPKPVMPEEVLARVNIHASFRKLQLDYEKSIDELQEEAEKNLLAQETLTKNNEVITSLFEKEKKNRWAQLSILDDQKRTLYALQQSENNLRAIFENTTTGFMLLDNHLKIISYNNRCSELAEIALGNPLKLGHLMVNLLPMERQKNFIEKLGRVLLDESVYYETSYPLSNGELIWLEISCRPVNDKNNKVIGISFAINDISERKKINEKLEDTVREIDTFIFRSSHDLKSPVSSLKGLLSIMKKEITDAKAKSFLPMIEQNNIRMENIVNDLSSVVLIKDESRKGTMIDFAELINSTIALFEPLPDVNKVKFKLNIEPAMSFVSDATLISTIFQNLIGNAIKYRQDDEGHIVSVVANHRHQGVYVSISDNGEGMTQEAKKRIFEMFFRGNLKSTGTGLGLYIVKKAIEKLDGIITVDSEPLKGSTFKVFIPVKED